MTKTNEVEATKKGRGRPAGKNPKGPYVPNGKPRGRPAGDNPRPAYVPNGRPKGRKLGWTKKLDKLDKRGAHWRVPDGEKIGKKEYVPTGNPRGRPSVPDDEKIVKKEYVPTGKPRGRPVGWKKTEEDN